MNLSSWVAIGFAVGGLVSLGSFTWRYITAERSRSQSATLFSDPMLRLVGIFVIALLAVVAPPASELGFGHPLLWVVLIIGATVAGADLILMLAAIIRKSDVYIAQHFALETKREENRVKAGQLSVESHEEMGDKLPAAKAPPAGASKSEHDALALVATAATTDAMRQQIFGQAPLGSQGWASAIGAVDPADLEPVRVAVISAGVDGEVAKLFAGRVEIAPGFAAEPQRGLPMGTATAAFVLAANPQARILSLNVFPEDTTIEMGQLAAAVRAALAWKPELIFFDGGGDGDAAELRAAFQNVTVPCIAPTANESTARPTFPAAYPGVTAVTAADGSEVAPFASYSKGTAVAAPGAQVPCVRRAENGQLVFQRISGTSIAAALVTAAAAVMIGRGQNLNGARLADLLKQTAAGTAKGIPILDIAALLGSGVPKKARLKKRLAPSAAPNSP
jgi:hypothetical protein